MPRLEHLRKTSQALRPVQHQPTGAGQYDLYPAFDLGPGKLQIGYAAPADALTHHSGKRPRTPAVCRPWSLVRKQNDA